MSETAERTIEVAGQRPRHVHHPRTLEALRALVANHDGPTLMPVGSANHLSLGAPPRQPFDAVEVRDALSGTIQHQEDDLTVVVPAGHTIGEVNAILAERGQRLPIDPPNAPGATFGGTLATGLAGPLRARFGPPRDLVLGMMVLRADGELVRAGGRVVKNVTGYDLMRLWCGSLGTLGIITEVALRVYPATEGVDLAVPVASVEEGATLAERLYRGDVRPEMADVVGDGAGQRLGVRVTAAAALVAKEILGPLAREPEPEADYLLSRDLGYATYDALLLSVSATPSMLMGAAEAVRLLGPSAIVVRPLVPVIRAAWRASDLPDRHTFARQLAAIRALLEDGRGSATVERMPPDWYRGIDPWGLPRSGLGIMKKLKAAYDPAGRLNRGRYAGGI